MDLFFISRARKKEKKTLLLSNGPRLPSFSSPKKFFVKTYTQTKLIGESPEEAEDSIGPRSTDDLEEYHPSERTREREMEYNWTPPLFVKKSFLLALSLIYINISLCHGG
jgi:hypothetical protein